MQGNSVESSCYLSVTSQSYDLEKPDSKQKSCVFPGTSLVLLWMDLKMSTLTKDMAAGKPPIESSKKDDLNRTVMVKPLVLIGVMLFAVAGPSFAQSSASTSVPLSATVIQGLSLTVSGALSFGAIVAGATPAPSLSAQTNPGAPLITIAGNGSQAVTVTFSTATLTGPGTSLTFTPSVYGSNSSSNQSGSTQVTSGGAVTLSGTSGSQGNYYLWLGGSLNAIPTNQTPGSYSGTWTISVNY